MIDHVFEAARRISPYLGETPTVFSERHQAWMKLETEQVTGAYKVRGALNALLKQVESGDRRTVVAASAGNHGAAVAWAAQRLGLEAVIVVPRDAPKTKIARIERLGARVIRQGEHFEESLRWALSLTRLKRARFLHAFDDPDVMAGQGTVALELLSLRPDVVVLPIGGGGLASGCGTVLYAAGIRVVGVQVEGVDAMRSPLKGGPVRIDPALTVADGLRVAQAGTLARQICAHVLDDVLLVKETCVRRMMASMARHEGMRVEGAGVVALAALDRVEGERRAVLLSGSNVDQAVLGAAVEEFPRDSVPTRRAQG